MKSERSFAALCGASPVQASSGQTIRHRLNRGGNRKANNALWPMRYHPDTPRRCHQPIRGPAQGRRKEPKRDNPLPEAAHRPRDLPAHHRPAPNPELRPATHPPPTSQHHYHPGRPTTRNPPGPYLKTRTRTQPQPPASNPIPEVAPHPPTSPTADLTTIGASPLNPVRFSSDNPDRVRERLVEQITPCVERHYLRLGVAGCVECAGREGVFTRLGVPVERKRCP